MIKVCHITTVHPSRYDVRIFEKECRSLAEYGFDVTLIINDDLPDEIKHKVKIRSLGVKADSRIQRITVVKKEAYKEALMVGADLYHLHDPELLLIALKLKKRGKKVVFDSHEFTAAQIASKQYIPRMLRGIISSIYRALESICLSRIDGIVEPCTYNGKDYFKNIDIPKVIIGNFPKVQLFENISDRHPDKEKICYIGSITEVRGIFQMIRACYLAGKRLVLIGDIEPELHAQVENMPEYSCVEYKGILPHELAIREISRCVLGLSVLEPKVQYTNIDNLPTKVYEYMSLGMPVVLSDFPYYMKTLEKYKYGIAVDPMDVQAIADAINTITADDKMAARMGIEGKRAIAEEMNWGEEAKKLVEFYKQLCRS